MHFDIKKDILQGQDLIDFIETNRSLGKTLEQLATELGITKDALKGRYRRAKDKENSKPEQQTKKTNKSIEKSAKESTEKVQMDAKKNTNEQKDITDRLDKIIELLEKNINVTPKDADVPTKEYNTLVVPVTEEYAKSSIRISKDVWEEFIDFCKKNKQFKQQDILTLAIKEFLEKYNK